MTWNLDPAHSGLQFAVKHMVISTVRGSFGEFAVDAEIDEANLANSRATVRIDAASLTTGNADRDAHLRSADFFDVEAHPSIVFESRGIERRGGDDYRITGDLTIRGITRAIVLDGEIQGPVKDPWGGLRFGLSASGKVNRKEFGLNWNAALEAGGFLVGDDVKLTIEAELVKAATPELVATA
ncbi:MAG: YceI family protein [Dehalococcoidia bacterium]|nr:YceI family protein [Dehalococcoidia bacterium]